jgi:hypothetical protein
MGARAVLLVEGKDDLYVFGYLFEHHRIPDQFVVKEKGGIDKLIESLDVEIDASDLERIGIVVDADTDINARWQSLQGVLRVSGYLTVPNAKRFITWIRAIFDLSEV